MNPPATRPKRKVTKGKAGVLRVPQVPSRLQCEIPTIHQLGDLIDCVQRMVLLPGIDQARLWKIAPHLEEIQKLVGLEKLKRTVLDQVLYYLQGLHRHAEHDYLHTLILGPPGTGKCLGRGVEVLLYNGLRKAVEDIQEGDQLMGDDATPRRCTGITQGRGEMFRVHQAQGLAYTANAEHILCLQQIAQPIFFYDARSEKYVLTWWDADGTHHIRFHHSRFLQSRTRFIQLLLQLPRAGTILEISIRDYLHHSRSSQWRSVFEGYKAPLNFPEHSPHLDATELARKLVSINCQGIPVQFRCNSAERRFELLLALLKELDPLSNTSDVWTIPELYFSAHSSFYNDLVFLATSLGLDCRIDPDSATLVVNTQTNISTYPIQVEPIGVDDYFGFELDGNRRFLLGDCTVTHNTTVARSLAQVYRDLDIMEHRPGSTCPFRIAYRNDFVAGYLGQTAAKTEKLLKSMLGGVLFIDEVYALGPGQDDKDSFAKEALDTLCSFLSEHTHDFCCIAAGYAEDVQCTLFQANRGLESRFQWKHTIDPYTPAELAQIFERALRQQNWDYVDLPSEATSFVETLTALFQQNPGLFAYSGRDVHNLLHKCKIAHGRRVFGRRGAVKFALTKSDLQLGFALYTESQSRPDTTPPPGMYI